MQLDNKTNKNTSHEICVFFFIISILKIIKLLLKQLTARKRKSIAPLAKVIREMGIIKM